MGKILLFGIVLGLGWTVYKVYHVFRPTPVAEAVHGPAGDPSKDVRRPEVNPAERFPDSEGSGDMNPLDPLPVLASCREWIYLEKWGFVRRGEQLPDDRVLVSWSGEDALVKGQRGVQRVRFRRGAEVEPYVPEGAPVEVVSPLASSGLSQVGEHPAGSGQAPSAVRPWR